MGGGGVKLPKQILNISQSQIPLWNNHFEYSCWSFGLFCAFCRFPPFPLLNLTLKRRGYWRTSTGGGGADSAPPIKINVPIHIYMCDACYNPIFSWRVRWKHFYPDQSSPGWPGTPRTTSWSCTARQILMAWYQRVIHVATLIFDDEGDENIFTSIWAIFKVEYQVKTLWPAHY